MDDAIVIGGGIVGASAAYHLARGGAHVTLIDQAQPGQATAAGAGIIAPGTTFHAPTAFFSLALRATAYYEELLARLAEDGESKTGYETVGLLHIATSEEENARLPILARLFAERQAAGFKNLGEICLLDSLEARALFPALGIVHGAVYVPDAARLDGRLMRDALRGAASFAGPESSSPSAKPPWFARVTAFLRCMPMARPSRQIALSSLPGHGPASSPKRSA